MMKRHARLSQILSQHGPFDVFHIQNVEGIPFDALTLKRRFSSVKFILSNHNYHTVCQQVNLWQQDSTRCTNYQDGVFTMTTFFKLISVVF